MVADLKKENKNKLTELDMQILDTESIIYKLKYEDHTMNDVLIGLYILRLMKLRNLKKHAEVADLINKSTPIVSNYIREANQVKKASRGRPSYKTLEIDKLFGEDLPIRLVSKLGVIPDLDLARMLHQTAEDLYKFKGDIEFEEVYPDQIKEYVFDLQKYCNIPLKIILEDDVKRRPSFEKLAKWIQKSLKVFELKDVVFNERVDKDISIRIVPLEKIEGNPLYLLETAVEKLQQLHEQETKKHGKLTVKELKEFYVVQEKENKSARGRPRYMRVDLDDLLEDDRVPFRVISKDGEITIYKLGVILEVAAERIYFNQKQGNQINWED